VIVVVTFVLPVLLAERFHDYLRGIRRNTRLKKSEKKKTRVLVLLAAQCVVGVGGYYGLKARQIRNTSYSVYNQLMQLLVGSPIP
jgi:hypothetical protein